MLNFVTRLEGLAWDRNSDTAVGFLNGVDNSLPIGTQDTSSVAIVGNRIVQIVEPRDAERSGSLLQWGRHHMTIFLVFLGLWGQIRHLTLLLVSDRGSNLA